MFWVVDNFLMRKGRTKAKLEERGANQDSRNGSKVRYRRAASHEESESEVGPGPRVADLRMPVVSCHASQGQGHEADSSQPDQTHPCCPGDLPATSPKPVERDRKGRSGPVPGKLARTCGPDR